LSHDNIRLYSGHAVVRNTINTAGNTSPLIKIKWKQTATHYGFTPKPPWGQMR